MLIKIIKNPGLSARPYVESLLLDINGVLHFKRGEIETNCENIELRLSQEQLAKIEALVLLLNFEKMKSIINKMGRILDSTKFKFEVVTSNGQIFCIEAPIFSYGNGHHLYKTVIIHFEILYTHLQSLIEESHNESAHRTR
jgi:hypothetical protein